MLPNHVPCNVDPVLGAYNAAMELDANTLLHHANLLMQDGVMRYPRGASATQHWQRQSELMFEAAGLLLAERTSEALVVIKQIDPDVLECLAPPAKEIGCYGWGNA